MTPERIRELAEQAYYNRHKPLTIEDIERAIHAALVECLSEPASQAMIAAA